MPPSSERSAANFLAGPYLDRRAEFREDPQWSAAARADDTTLFLPVCGTALGVVGDPPTAAFVDCGHALVQASDDDSLVLLGWFRERRCVLLQLDARSDRLATTADSSLRFEELRPLAPTLDAAEAGLLAYARALSYWRARHRFCGVCGTPTRPLRAGHVMQCRDPGCASEFFPRIDPAIIVLVSDGERALLGRQASWPPGRYSTIAGFVEPGESLEDAVAREVLEETCVVVSTSDYHSSQPWPFPSSLMLGFMASAPPGSRAGGSSELEDARWFTREQLVAGAVLLPPPTSISYRLIETWFDADSATPMRSLVRRSWSGRTAAPR
jgi:NAD+ diphosphatase